MKRIDAVREGIQLLSGRWELEVMAALHERSHGHAELTRLIGLDGKQLTRVLHRLRRRGCVERRVATEESPVRVRYALTPGGDRLVTAALVFSRWRDDELDLRGA